MIEILSNIGLFILFLAAAALAALVLFWKYTEFKYRWSWTAKCPSCSTQHSSEQNYKCMNCNKGHLFAHQIITETFIGCKNCNEITTLYCQSPDCETDLSGVIKIPFITRLFLKIFINKHLKLFKI